jgi:Tol biopolymer transport system component/DNA-binding winged helix-turn-helix (wHTH) protein
MRDAPLPESRIRRFGPFELDLSSGELRKDGVRVALQDQPLQILVVLSERPGELVNRDELRRQLWPADTYVDFEHGLNAAVKRLRDALGDSADNPRFVETVPRRGYRFVASVDRTSASSPARVHLRWWIATTAAAIVVSGVAVAWLFITRDPLLRPSQRLLTRLTFDPGLQTDPTWSPDARFIAYSSDRSGNFDIWVQSVAGGNAVQVTREPAHDWQPDWSPDGSQIVFRSDRQGGGLFLVPALGGETRTLTSFGYLPRWSPDGTRILFSAAGVQNASDKPSLHVVRLDGSPPQQILQQFLSNFPGRPTFAWHPDGRRVTFWGFFGQHPRFWTVPVDGGVPLKSEWDPRVKDAWEQAALRASVENFAWGRSGRSMFFTGYSREVANIWKVDIDPDTLRWVAGPERMTTGAGSDTHLALARDGRRIAFATAADNSRIWSIPFDPTAGLLKGPGEPLTQQASNSFLPDMTLDGKRLLFYTEQPGRPPEHRLTEKLLLDGRERVLVTTTPFHEGRDLPRWSPSGAQVAYRHWLAAGPHTPIVSCSIRILDVVTGQERQLTTAFRPEEGCYENPYAWTHDGEWIAATGTRYAANSFALALLPVSAAPRAETRARIVTSDIYNALWQPAISPDNRWIAFNATAPTHTGISTMYVVPLAGGAWTQLTEGLHWDDKPRWSPDGRSIYFISSRGGDYNVWRIGWDPSHGVAIGTPSPVTRFHGPRRMILPDVYAMELVVARDRLVLPLTDASGAIWTLDNVDR